MKTWLRKNLALFLVLCMCVSLCPVSVAAEDTSAIEAVTTTVQPLDPTANDPVTVTTANIFPLQSNTYFSFEGLPKETSLYLHVTEGTGIDYYASIYGGTDGSGMWSNSFRFEAGEHTFTLTVCDRQQTPLYEPATITVEYAETLPVTLEELKGMVDPEELSPKYDYFRVDAYLPVNTLTGEEELRFEVVKDGICYAVSTANNAPYIDNNDRVGDTRYHDIFGQKIYVPLPVQSARCYVYCGRTLKNGIYDVYLYADGVLITSWEGAVCTSQPIVNLYCRDGAAGAYNIPGSKVAGCTLSITNGNPADFTVKLKCQEEVIGTSEDYRVVQVDENSCEAVYYIQLDEPMERYQEYEISVSYTGEGDFTLENSDTDIYIRQKGAADCECIQFGSYYYANFAIPSQGYDAGVKYRFDLVDDWGDLLATTYASPNNDGVFSVEFRDEDGDLMELAEYQSYDIEFYGDLDNANYSSARWQVYNWHISREEAAFSLLGAEQTVVLNVEDANCWQKDKNNFGVRLWGESAVITGVFNNKNQYQLRLTSVTGEEYLLSASADSELLNNGTCADLWFTVPEGMEEAYYTSSLLYNGKLVVNDHQENLFPANQMQKFSTSASVGIGSNRMHEIIAAYMVDVQNLDGMDLTLDFFSLTNGTSEPDHTITLEETNGYWLVAEDLSALNPAARYQAVISVDGEVLHVTDYEYWVTEEVLDESYGKYGTAVVAEEMEDYLEIVPCYTNYNEEYGIPYFSEVYVNVTAPEGKALQYITVNGEAICGNGFLFTENCEVSAVFAEPDTETYKVTVQMGLEEYVYGDDMTEAELEELLGSMSPGEREEFLANGGSGRVFKVLHSYEVKLPPNSMQELDLSLPAELSNYKLNSYNIDVECADPKQWAGISFNDTQTRWFLDMPECDVLVKIGLQEKQKYYVNALYDESLGTVTGLASDFSYVTEGETVSFMAEPTENNLLQSVYYEYYDYRNGGDQHIELTPNASGAYSFVMPACGVQLYINFTTSGPYEVSVYTYGLGTFTLSEAEGEGGYMAGETVTLTLIPQEGSRLAKKDGLQGHYWIGDRSHDISFTKVSDTVYTFVMPHSNVWMEIRYELTPGIAPGGTVTDNATLITALGGADNAVLDEETGVVQLLQNVELQEPILFAPEEPAEFLLDLKGKRITAIEDNETIESGALILGNQGFARLTLTSSASGGGVFTDELIRANFHTIWVQGGTLTVNSPSNKIAVHSAYSTVKRSCAGIRVAGGVAMLDDLYVEGMLSGDALHLSGGKTTINGGDYHGGMDYYNQYLNQQPDGLNLLGGYEDYSWITSKSLGGDAIRVSGRAEVEINDAWAYGGPHGAALHVDNRASAQYPCKVNVRGGIYNADAGKGLLVESGNVELTIHYGTFYYGESNYGGHSMDVTTFGCIADYLAADRKVVNLSRYIGQVNGVDTYEELTDAELQKSYLWDNVEVLDGPVTATNAELDKMLGELETVTPETITPETITTIQTAVGNMDNLAAALEQDIPGDSNGTTEKLADLEKAIGIAEIEIENEAFQIDNTQASVTGAVINAGGNVTLNIAQAEVAEKEELSVTYQNAQHFSMTLKVNEEEVTLRTPVKVVLPVPANVNPALLMILHYNEQSEEWDAITPTVYQIEDQWYMSFVAGSFSDFAVAHKVSVLKDSENAGIWVTLDVHEKAAEDQQFLCAIYNEQGQMLKFNVINGEAFIELGSEYYSAYELKVFATDADDTWAPKYEVDTIPLLNN